MVIQQTEDYSTFEFINGNRTVSMVKVRKIIKDVEGGLNLFPVPLRMSCSMLQRNVITGGGQDLVRFKDGNFECIYLEETKTLIGLVDYLFGDYTFIRSRDLLEAVKHLQTTAKWDVETMAEKIKKNRHAVQEQSSKKTWLFHLNQIYNIRNQKIQHII